jgi:MoaA/NifB/PqqE/SkfB family radical SAM enzyme
VSAGTKNLRLAGIDAGRPLTGPETIHVDITNGCNTNCITCWDHSPLLQLGRSGAWKKQKIDAATVAEILNDVADLGGLQAVILSGMGEPFTHPDIYTMIAEVKRRGLHLTLITNLVAADAQRIADLGVDQLLIGIHGATEASYRAFHPNFVRDEWQRLLHMLGELCARGRRYKHVQVICQTNAHELVEMVRLGARYQAEQLNFKLASLREGTERIGITDTQRQQLVAELVPAAMAEATALAVKTNLPAFAQQLAAGGADTAPIEEVGCFMGYAYSRILVDGTVLYCCNTEVKVGTLAGGTTFAELWEGPTWQALRARMRRGEYFDSCRQCGKFNQNVQLGQRFAQVYGEERLYEITGRRPRPEGAVARHASTDD